MRKCVGHLWFFILACLVALLLVALGLRLYYHQSRLDSILSQTLSLQTFTADSGQIQFDTTLNALKVLPDASKNSLISKQYLQIKANLFERLEIVFLNKASQQVLTLLIGTTDKNETANSVTYPILYTDKTISRIPINALIKDNVVINKIQLTTPRLLVPYKIKSLKFVPKQLSSTDFLLLLWQDFSNTKTALLLPVKLLLIIYFSVVAFLFAVLLKWRKKSLTRLWWWILIAAWALLDMRYFYQHSQRYLGLQPQNPIIISEPTQAITWGKMVTLSQDNINQWKTGG